MHYLIQENLFKERNYDLIINTIDRLGLTYDIVSIIPFTDKIQIKITDENEINSYVDFETEHKNVFCFGSVKFAHIGAKMGWYPGSMFNANHDFEVYGPKYKGHLLNEDAFYMKLTDKLPEHNKVMFFARPCRDTKLFTGGVFMEDSWYELVENIKKNGNTLIDNEIGDEIVMINTLKNITFETRCWVVNGKVITMSEYRRGRFTITTNVDDNLILKNKVQKLVDIYQPAEAFVIDVCETEEEPDVLKIVEINCLNCSGFYEGNMPKVIEELDDYFTLDKPTYNL